MPDWGQLFELSVHPLELIARGTAMYFFLFALLRFVLRRDVGSIGIADVLLLVLIADAAQNAMAGGYESVTDGCILVATIAGWNWILDAVSFRFPAVRQLLEPQPLPLVKAGRLLRRNLRREMISTEEMMSVLREHGIERLDQVKLATMESDGEISVLKYETGPEPEAPGRKSKTPA